MTKAFWSAAICALALSAPAAYAQTAKKPAKPAAAPVKTAPPAPAQGSRGIGKGDSEFSVFGNYTTHDEDDFAGDQLLIGASFGQFVSDKLELRVTPVIVYTDGAAGSSFTFAPFISGEFVFMNRSPVAPFIGGGIGFQFLYIEGNAPVGDTYGVGIGIGPTAGAKFFVSERASLELALTYQIGYLSLSNDSTSTDADYDELRQDLRFNFYY